MCSLATECVLLCVVAVGGIIFSGGAYGAIEEGVGRGGRGDGVGYRVQGIGCREYGARFRVQEAGSSGVCIVT